MPTPIAARLAWFYAVLFAITGLQLPFWPAWLAARGLTAQEIGALLAIGQWIKLAANPLAGMAADRSGDSRRVMLLLSLGLLGGFGAFLPAQGFVALLVLNAATSACLSALIPLGDSMALAAAAAGRLDYGRVRLAGSLGFIVASVLAGYLLQGRGTALLIYLLIGGAGGVALAALMLPAGPRLRQPRLAGWRSLARPGFLVFVFAATLIQGSHALYYGFGTLHWRKLGFGDVTIAALWAEGVIAEIALFYWGTALLNRLSPAGLLALAGGAGLLRWSATALLASPALLATVQLLHAFTFAAAHLALMHHIARTVPAKLAATAQGLCTAMISGIGAGLLMLLAGVLYGAMGGAAYFAMAALAGLGAAVGLAHTATKS